MKSVSHSHYYSSPRHPLITHYCLSSSVLLLASFACLTSLDTKVSYFIRFSYSLAPALPFQSPRMGKCYHLASKFPVPACQTLLKKVTESGWLVPLQSWAISSELGSHCFLTGLVLVSDLQAFVFSLVSVSRFLHTQSLCNMIFHFPEKSQDQDLISLLCFSISQLNLSFWFHRKELSASFKDFHSFH